MPRVIRPAAHFDGSASTMTGVDSQLKRLCRYLEGLNYTVSAQFTTHEVDGTIDDEAVIHLALGATATIGGMASVTWMELISDVRDCFSHRGDSGYGPRQEKMDAPRFVTLLGEVTESINKRTPSESRLVSFWLKDGHPFYPVFWDFAYLIRHPDVSHVLIASSSD